MKKGINTAEKNGMWKGGEVKLDALHIWVAKRISKPKQCPSCLKVRRLDLANISQKYKRALADWEWLCRRCHMEKDGRMKRLVIRNQRRTLKKRRCVECGHWFKPWNSSSRCCSLSCNAKRGNRIRHHA